MVVICEGVVSEDGTLKEGGDPRTYMQFWPLAED